MKWTQLERDAAIRVAVAAGVTLREISKILGLSHQGMAQIVKDTEQAAPSRRRAFFTLSAWSSPDARNLHPPL
jgi:hypothetical protein